MEQLIIKLRKTFLWSMLITFMMAFLVIVGVVEVLFVVQGHYLLSLALATGLFGLFTWVSATFYFKTLQKEPADVARFYMIYLSLRFVLGGLLLFACTRLSDCENMHLLLYSFCAIFLFTLISETGLFIHIEKKLNENQKYK